MKFIESLYLSHTSQVNEPQFWLLIDPDKWNDKLLQQVAKTANSAGVDTILVGTSILISGNVSETVKTIKAYYNGPVILFPGAGAQLCPDVDGLLYLVLLSSRNPRWLIDEQVLSAPFVYRHKLKVIPTGYILIDPGKLTAVHFFSGTPPIPSEKPEIAVAHALAGQYMGMKLIFLEGGSGAKKPVPVEIIKAVKKAVDVPIAVGGGICSAEMSNKIAKYADIIVVGNFFENPKNMTLLPKFSEVIKNARKKTL